MTHKYERKCWSCGKNTLKPFDDVGHSWLKCSNCGATDIPNPVHLGEGTIVVERVEKSARETKYRPQKQRTSKKPVLA